MLTRFKIGHYSDQKAATGCTVIVPPLPNVASAAIRGSAPGTREYGLLSPLRKVSQIHALVLTGGSAFGLNAAHGVMEALAEQNVGYQTDYGVVPIVPAAVIFDKNVGKNEAYPTAAHGRRAFWAARYQELTQGNVGAGTGATVGKWAGMEHAMKTGLGLAQVESGASKVAALVVLNAVGDVFDFTGKIIAGAVDENNRFIGQQKTWQRWQGAYIGMADNTVLVAVMTNVRLDKLQAHLLAEQAHHGIARRIFPSHTSYDGDIVFVISAPEEEANFDQLTAMTVTAVEQAIINSAQQAAPAYGFKSYQTLFQGGGA